MNSLYERSRNHCLRAYNAPGMYPGPNSQSQNSTYTHAVSILPIYLLVLLFITSRGSCNMLACFLLPLLQRLYNLPAGVLLFLLPSFLPCLVPHILGTYLQLSCFLSYTYSYKLFACFLFFLVGKIYNLLSSCFAS